MNEPKYTMFDVCFKDLLRQHAESLISTLMSAGKEVRVKKVASGGAFCSDRFDVFVKGECCKEMEVHV